MNVTGTIIGIIVVVAIVGIIVYRYCFEDRIKARRKRK